MQLVRGVILLNATPFWTVYSLRALAPLGLATVPLPPAATEFVRNTVFGYLSDPNTISTVLKQVRPAAWRPAQLSYKPCFDGDLGLAICKPKSMAQKLMYHMDAVSGTCSPQ